jgi:hypothetical protein
MTEAVEHDGSSGRSQGHPSLDWIYWAIPLALLALQWSATSASMGKIGYEELGESVRDVYWLDHRLLYDGMSSNVGWYGTLLIVYKLFGFSLVEAKYVRLALHLVGLLCAADLLRRSMGARNAVVPLLVIGLSPTLLYFNTLQTSFGTDLPYAAICVWLLYSIRFRSTADAAKSFGLGAIAMVGALSYPAFLFYLPSFALAALWHWRNRSDTGHPSGAIYPASAAVGFVLPLALAFLFAGPPQMLIRDPVTGSGLFRGGARLGLDPTLFSQSLLTCLDDLFSRGSSYYFDLTQPEFSGVLAILSLGCVAVTVGYLAATRRMEFLLLEAVVLLLFVSLFVPNLAVSGLAGMRRCTGVLAAFYVFFAMTWKFFASTSIGNAWLARCGLLLCALLPLSHALSYGSLLADISRPNPELKGLRAGAVRWFSARASPAASLQHFLDLTAAGQPLRCPKDQDKDEPCRYAEIYAALAGYRSWNHLPAPEIRALDWRTGKVITLSPALWADYYFPH